MENLDKFNKTICRKCSTDLKENVVFFFLPYFEKLWCIWNCYFFFVEGFQYMTPDCGPLTRKMRKVMTRLRSCFIPSCVFNSVGLKSIILCLVLSWEETLHFHLFSHLTFRTTGIMLEEILCKSMRTALFINPSVLFLFFFFHCFPAPIFSNILKNDAY